MLLCCICILTTTTTQQIQCNAIKSFNEKLWTRRRQASKTFHYITEFSLCVCVCVSFGVNASKSSHHTNVMGMQRPASVAWFLKIWNQKQEKKKNVLVKV